MSRTKFWSMFVACCLLLAGFGVAGTASADEADARAAAGAGFGAETDAGRSTTDPVGLVTVVHGIPGLTVDIYVNGELALPDFEPGTVTDPLALPVGTYDIVIVAAGGDPAQPVLQTSAEVTAYSNASIIAHLDANGAPTISAFANHIDELANRQTRFVVRHLAAAPAVDVDVFKGRAGQQFIATFESLENGDESKIEGRRGVYAATIRAAGTDTVVTGPVPLYLPKQTTTIVYAVGSLADGTFQLLLQTIDLRDLPMPPAPGYLRVVHGVPGLTVDVFVNGQLTLEDFEPKTVTPYIELPAGDYDIAVAPADAGLENAVITASATVASDVYASAVANLDADGTPELTVFVDRLARLYWGFTRFVARHTAAAPTVDVELFRPSWHITYKARDISNGHQASGVFWRGDYEATIKAAGTDTVVAGPVPVTLPAKNVTTVYAIGDFAGGTFDLILDQFNAYEPPILAPNAMRGTVFMDTNGDGVRQASESVIPGASVVVNGARSGQSVETDGFGRFAMYSVEAGTHTLSVLDMEELTGSTVSMTVSDDNNGTVEIPMTAAQAAPTAVALNSTNTGTNNSSVALLALAMIAFASAVVVKRKTD